MKAKVVTLDRYTQREDVGELARETIEYVLKMIVEHPDELSVSVSHHERTTILKVDCSHRNFPKVLGAKGKMISSIRNLALALTAKYGYRSIVEIPYFTP